MDQGLDDRQVKHLAAEAQCDPRTVLRFLRGERVRPMCADRIREAARKLKIEVRA